ncbi:MAG TPA: AMP-binding protein [Streptosporangiaceae bacterium]|nr:AMP-binding protein [Streptosporangiaceae bacterium]
MRENFATVLETVADVRADRTAVTHGNRSVTWRQLDDRASRLAAFLAGRGVGADARVAIALYNGIEYLESVFAILKLRAIPVNVNYRYQPEEMRHLFDDAQVTAVIFGASLAARVTAAQAGAPAVHTLVQVGDAVRAGDPVPAGDAAATAGTPVSGYEHVISGTSPLPRTERGVGRWLMYTGGTTGKPKAVLVSHAWLYPVVSANGFLLIGEPVPDSLDALRAATERLSARGDAIVCLPAPPLMHATGMYTSLGALLASGRVVYLTRRSYDAGELARTIAPQHVDTVSIVGDVFALPLADALDRAAADGRPYDVSSLRRILSVGVTWSADVKRRLLAYGDFVCRDVVAASEGGPFAVSETRRGDSAITSRFTLLPGARVIDESGQDVVPGSGQVGVLAAPTDDEIAYLGDAAKTAETFRTFGGRRWVVPGDLASVAADGSITFHGRGSRVINTGGEKVFAEEVEQVLIEHPDVRDALVVGVRDPRWGHRVAAVVAPEGDAAPTADALVAYVAGRLADYKKPRAIVFVPDIQRGPSGKADLRWAQATAASADPSTP